MSGAWTSPTTAPGARCWNSSSGVTPGHRRCPKPNTCVGFGTGASAPGFTPTRSWTDSCTPPFGSRPAATSRENTPPARSRHRPARGQALLAPDRATGWRPKAISVAPEGNIHWPPDPQILTECPSVEAVPQTSGARLSRGQSHRSCRDSVRLYTGLFVFRLVLAELARKHRGE